MTTEKMPATVRVGETALGGGSFALFFFNIALAVSSAVICLIGIIRFYRAN